MCEKTESSVARVLCSVAHVSCVWPGGPRGIGYWLSTVV